MSDLDIVVQHLAVAIASWRAGPTADPGRHVAAADAIGMVVDVETRHGSSVALRLWMEAVDRSRGAYAPDRRSP